MASRMGNHDRHTIDDTTTSCILSSLHCYVVALHCHNQKNGTCEPRLCAMCSDTHFPWVSKLRTLARPKADQSYPSQEEAHEVVYWDGSWGVRWSSHHHQGGVDEDPLASDDFMWNKDFVGRFKKLIQDPQAPSPPAKVWILSHFVLSLTQCPSGLGVFLNSDVVYWSLFLLDSWIDVGRLFVGHCASWLWWLFFVSDFGFFVCLK